MDCIALGVVMTSRLGLRGMLDMFSGGRVGIRGPAVVFCARCWDLWGYEGAFGPMVGIISFGWGRTGSQVGILF